MKMEGMEGEVYIDNADDNTEMEVTEQQEEEEEQVGVKYFHIF